jgi:hypothetical protein
MPSTAAQLSTLKKRGKVQNPESSFRTGSFHFFQPPDFKQRYKKMNFGRKRNLEFTLIFHPVRIQTTGSGSEQIT